MALRKTLGRNMPKSDIEVPANLRSYAVESDGEIADRLGTIPKKFTPSNLKTVQNKAAQGNLGPLYELYVKMQSTESRYGGIVSQLENAISGLPIKVIGREGKTAKETEIADEYADMMEEALTHFDVQGFVKDAVTAYTRGTQVFQMTYDTVELPYNRVVAMPNKLKPVSHARLGWDTEYKSDYYGELTIKVNLDDSGTPIRKFDERNIFHIVDGNAEGFFDTLGAARRCLGWYLCKVYAQQWWMQYIENYGQPIRIGRYQEGASEDSKKNMKKFLKTLGKAAYGLFPQTAEVQLIEANHSGQVTTYRDIINKANEEYAVSLLGQSDTIGDKRNGSFARATVMNSIRHETLQHIGTLVEKAFQELADRVLRINYGGEYIKRLRPRVTPVISNPQDGQTKSLTYGNLQDQGVPISMEQYRDEFGIVKPKVGETVVINGMRYIVEENDEYTQIEDEASQNHPSRQELNQTDNEGDQEEDRNDSQQEDQEDS